MSNEKKNEPDLKDQFDKMKERLSSGGKGKPSGKKPFNFYWIYGIIVAVILLIQVFAWSGRSGSLRLLWHLPKVLLGYKILLFLFETHALQR